MNFRELMIRSNGLEFSALEAGVRGAPVCICVHGFPDYARTWRFLLPVLANAGYYAIAPYTRGYTPSSIPANGSYHASTLAKDILGIIDALGEEQAILIGHDWGADAVYGASILAPERVRLLVTLGGPHPINTLALSNYDQLKRFWYSFYFLTPEAELVVKADNFAFLDRLWIDWSPSYRLSPEEAQALKAIFNTPGVLTAALGYYRCLTDQSNPDKNLINEAHRVLTESIPVETLYIHGEDNGCIGVNLLDSMDKAYIGGLHKRIIPGAGHFVHLESPDVVNALILEFIQSRFSHQLS